MSSLNIRNIKNWDYKTFKSWLKSDDVDSDENDIFDFKERIYSCGKECRKDFSSFANSEGGFIIFGVDNNTKKPVDVKELDTLGNKLSLFNFPPKSVRNLNKL